MGDRTKEGEDHLAHEPFVQQVRQAIVMRSSQSRSNGSKAEAGPPKEGLPTYSRCLMFLQNNGANTYLRSQCCYGGGGALRESLACIALNLEEEWHMHAVRLAKL